jgi:hypothetical protein
LLILAERPTVTDDGCMLRDFLARLRVSTRPKPPERYVAVPGWGEPPPTRPVDEIAWTALLVGQDVPVPCHFADGSVRWGCAGGTGAGGRCDGIPVSESPSPEQRAEHVRVLGSDSVTCSGTSSIAGFFEGDVVIAACWAHEDWLRRHAWIDGMQSGVICRQGEHGVWQLVVTERPFPGAIKRWRANHPGWEAIDASDRATVAEVFPPTERETHTGASVPWIEKRLRYLASEAGMTLPDELGSLELVGRGGSHDAPVGQWRDAEDFIAEWTAEGRRWVDLNLDLDPAGRPRLVYEVEPDVTGSPLPSGMGPAIVESIGPLPSTIPG